ncbi:MAG: hypothetical protein GTN40_05630, partial [Candidatus Aenigmarchaeota archaeon]|nr:hypothetical protein [Candidatus Aenigmarchaeota archaeon]
NSNNLNIKNKIGGSANTGDNEANYNTSNGSITTGDASVKINVKNKGNTITGGVGAGEGEGPGEEVQPLDGIVEEIEKIAEVLGVGGVRPTALPRAGASILGLSLISSILGFSIWKLKKRKLS